MLPLVRQCRGEQFLQSPRGTLHRRSLAHSLHRDTDSSWTLVGCINNYVRNISSNNTTYNNTTTTQHTTTTQQHNTQQHNRHLLEEGLVLWDGEVDGEETRTEGGAKGVAVHQSYLCADWLMLEQVLLRGDHVCQDLSVRLHNGRHCLTSDGRQQF